MFKDGYMGEDKDQKGPGCICGSNEEHDSSHILIVSCGPWTVVVLNFMMISSFFHKQQFDAYNKYMQAYNHAFNSVSRMSNILFLGQKEAASDFFSSLTLGTPFLINLSLSLWKILCHA